MKKVKGLLLVIACAVSLFGVKVFANDINTHVGGTGSLSGLNAQYQLQGPNPSGITLNGTSWTATLPGKADTVVKTGSIGEDYTTEQQDIPGYTFKEVQGNPTGKFSDQAQTVVYIYQKNEDIPVTGTVIVNYEDDKGNSLSDPVVKTGTIGDTYTTEEKKNQRLYF